MTNSELEQFCLLAEKQKGHACVALIKEVLKKDTIFVFGELLNISSIIQLKDTNEFSLAYHTLELFAYGFYSDYVKSRSSYLNLSDYQIRKLKLLSLVSLTCNIKTLSYSAIQKELDIDDLRQLEDLMIEAIYKKLIVGKLDQKNGYLRVTDIMARDNHPDTLPDLIDKFMIWKKNCGDSVIEIEKSSAYLKENREKRQKEQMELQVQAEKVKAIVSKDKSSKVDEGGEHQSSRNFRSGAGAGGFPQQQSCNHHRGRREGGGGAHFYLKGGDESDGNEGIDDQDSDNDDDDSVGSAVGVSGSGIEPYSSYSSAAAASMDTVEDDNDVMMEQYIMSQLQSSSASSANVSRVGESSSSHASPLSQMQQTSVSSVRSAKRIKAIPNNSGGSNNNAGGSRSAPGSSSSSHQS